MPSTWLKDRPYIALAYMTGILPVKKYGAHSALNMFTELSMLTPDWMAPYTAFTEAEVRALCAERGRDSRWHCGRGRVLWWSSRWTAPPPTPSLKFVSVTMRMR